MVVSNIFSCKDLSTPISQSAQYQISILVLSLFPSHPLTPTPTQPQPPARSIEHWHKTVVCAALAMDECGSQCSADFLQAAPGLRVCSRQSLLREPSPHAQGCLSTQSFSSCEFLLWLCFSSSTSCLRHFCCLSIS